MECILHKYRVESITDLIPHEHGMLLIDGILDFQENKSIKTFFKISKNNIFFDENINGIYSFVCFECIAQSLGIYNGIKDKMSSIVQEDNLIGVLVNVSNLECYKPYIEADSDIIIDVYDINIIGSSIMNARGSISVCGEKIMEASLTVSIIDYKKIL